MAHSTVITHYTRQQRIFLMDPFTLIVWWKTATSLKISLLASCKNVSIGGDDAGRPATASRHKCGEDAAAVRERLSIHLLSPDLDYYTRTYRVELRPAAARATATLCAAAAIVTTTTSLNLTSCVLVPPLCWATRFFSFVLHQDSRTWRTSRHIIIRAISQK